MKKIAKWFNPQANSVVALELQFEELERSFESELINTYGLRPSYRKRTEAQSNKSFDCNRVVESFLIAALMLFSALEEVDWLFFSANSKNDDLIEDLSSWNIYQLVAFTPFFSEPHD